MAVSVNPISIVKVRGNDPANHQDLLAVEEPLEIRLGYGPSDNRAQRSLAVTMRTPDNDLELAAGFLLTEGIIQSASDFLRIKHCTDRDGKLSENIVRVELQPEIQLDWSRFSRHFYTNSSCGICGKASIESLAQMCTPEVDSDFRVSAEVLHSLNARMRAAQNVFEHTGSLHAAALFDKYGELLLLREDVGRHNALDKIIGAAMYADMMPLADKIIMLSGRSCFELIQKGLVAKIPLMLAVGAPSSLAVKTASEFGLTLIGFAKNEAFNIYSAPEKVLF